MTIFTVDLLFLEWDFTYTEVITRRRETSLGLEGFGVLWVRGGNHDGSDEGGKEVRELHFDRFNVDVPWDSCIADVGDIVY